MTSIVALAKHIFNNTTYSICHGCSKELEQTMVCSKCKTAAYCSEQCFEKAYDTHTIICSLIGAAGDKRKRPVKKGDDRNVRARGEKGMPVELAEDVIRLLAGNDIWLMELVKDTPIEEIGRWARVSRDFKHYLSENQRFWWHFMIHHKPEVLISPKYQRDLDYKAIARRFMGGLDIHFDQNSYLSEQERVAFNTFQLLASNPGGVLKRYVKTSEIMDLLGSMISSKAFRYYFYNSGIFWYYVAKYHLKHLYTYNNRGKDAVSYRRYTQQYDPDVAYQAFVYSQVNNEPLTFTYSNGSVDVSMPDTSRYPSIVHNGRDVIVPYIFLLSNGMDVVWSILEPTDVQDHVDGDFDGHDVTLNLNTEMYDVSVTGSEDLDFMLVDWHVNPPSVVGIVGPGDTYDISVGHNDLEETDITFIWPNDRIAPVNLTLDATQWPNTGKRVIEGVTVMVGASYTWSRYLPDVWLGAATQRAVDLSKYQIDYTPLSSIDLEQYISDAVDSGEYNIVVEIVHVSE